MIGDYFAQESTNGLNWFAQCARFYAVCKIGLKISSSFWEQRQES